MPPKRKPSPNRNNTATASSTAKPVPASAPLASSPVPIPSRSQPQAGTRNPPPALNPLSLAMSPPKEYHSDAVHLQLQSASAAAMDEMVATNLSRVLIIYTGGTIGMQHTREMGYVPVPNYLTQVLSSQTRFHDPTDSVARDASGASVAIPGGPLPRRLANKVVRQMGESPERVEALVTPVSLWGKRIVYSVLEYDPLLDSSNMSMQDWAKIASDVELNYEHYDAFIILHGTDTMAYTASALSFMLENLGKTVILTGSQVPLAEVRNDAIENLLGALTIAGHFIIPEVTLYFHNKLYRGNRTSKVDAVDFSAFDSPNLSPLVSVGINIDVQWRDIWRPRDLAKFRAHKSLDPNVATLRLFPGITLSTIRAFLQPPIRGVVLETFGAGNGPDARTDILAALREAHDRGVVLVNCTQCRRGLVTDLYSTGKALVQAGVVPGADMTTEAALTKLSYLLGKGLDPETIRRLIRRPLRGELTVVDPRPRFALSKRDFAAVLHHILGRAATTQRVPGQPEDSDSEDVHLSSTPDPHSHLLHPPMSPTRPASAPPHDPHDPLTALTPIPTTPTTATSVPQMERTLAPMMLALAAAQGRADHVAFLHKECPTIPFNLADPLTGAPPLHHAAANAQPATTRYLLAHGANVHARDRKGHSALWAAVVGQAGGASCVSDSGRPAAAALLSASAADALGDAAEAQDPRDEVIDMLVQTGAHLVKDEAVRAGVEALWACMRGDLVTVKRWLRAGLGVGVQVGPEKKGLLHAVRLGSFYVAVWV
ncbi:asparaginase-domain-containing protein [Catenaria anguillulae PL171]|uniref:asparaginase n=1 Tax=Catenaria anguillulae PL171 TaxID=765915 RepID=A0A1Y2HEV1_9FUNG|nr:asparaginase-domain-containing protein [Catenaria anguillulae PL171]